MNPGPESQRARAQLMIWWIVWSVILTGLILIYLFFGRGSLKPGTGADVLVNLSGVVPLFLSIIIRWLVLPRYNDLARAFPMFVIGLALAEGCGLLGIFLGGVYRDDLFLLGVLGVTQYVPLFAKKLLEPKGTGFIPNN